jgi:hypothetical protein
VGVCVAPGGNGVGAGVGVGVGAAVGASVVGVAVGACVVRASQMGALFPLALPL